MAASKEERSTSEGEKKEENNAEGTERESRLDTEGGNDKPFFTMTAKLLNMRATT